eukprot:5822238-Ditylum_brightwellii.AAC.1
MNGKEVPCCLEYHRTAASVWPTGSKVNLVGVLRTGLSVSTFSLRGSSVLNLWSFGFCLHAP